MAVDEVVAAELYTVHPAGFVAARNAAVAQARKAGDRDLATAIGKLRRPTLSAWAVNLLVHSAGAEVTELLSLGEELRAAQQRLLGEQLRRLNQQRPEVIGALARRARQLAADAGHPLGGAASTEVEQTLAAALADPDSAEAVRAGQLTRPLQHIGLGAEPLVAVPPDSGTPAGPVQSSSPGPSPGRPGPDDEIARGRQRRAERAARDLARAGQDLDEASARADQADQQQRDAAERYAEIERRIAELEQERELAERERADAQRRARSAARVRDEAQRRLQRLTEDQRAAR